MGIRCDVVRIGIFCCLLGMSWRLSATETETRVPSDAPTGDHAGDHAGSESQPPEVDAGIKLAALERNVELARVMRADLLEVNRATGTPGLDRNDIASLLVFDYRQVDLHKRSIELAFQELSRQQTAPPETLVEFLWQQTEHLRLMHASEGMRRSIERIRKRLPTREDVADQQLTELAADTFRQGKGMHIEYSGPPLRMNPRESIARYAIPLRYVRAAGMPPTGCRIVSTMQIGRGGEDAQAVSYHNGYQPNAFRVGRIQGEYMTFGEFEVPAGAARIFVHAYSAFSDNQNAGTIISNTIAVPVVLEGVQHDPAVVATGTARVPQVTSEPASSPE